MPKQFVWGNSKAGVAIQSRNRIAKGRYWWDIVHYKNGKPVMTHRDYPSKTEAIAEARSYARYERKHPKAGLLHIASSGGKRGLPKYNRPR